MIGHDTTATTVAMACYLLTKNRKAEAKVQEEIRKFGNVDNIK